MGVDYSELKEFQKKLEYIIDEKNLQEFFQKCVKELALRFLSQVIKLTPVADPKKYRKERRIKQDGHYVKYKRSSKKKGYKAGDFKTKLVNTYANGTGGTLRRGWVVKTQEEAEVNKTKPTVIDIKTFLENVKVLKTSTGYKLELINPVKYAIYVNYGHRTRGGKGFIDGIFFLEKAERYINSNIDKFLQKKLDEYLGSAFI